METVGIEERRLESSQGQIRIQRDLSPILQLRGKDRMEAILSSDYPQEIFQSLPVEEAYFTIKEIGEQDALPLLSLMSPGQCQYLLDLEVWKGYEIQLGMKGAGGQIFILDFISISIKHFDNGETSFNSV